MEQRELLALLKRVERGEERAEDAYRALRLCPFEDLGYAKVDHHRALRQGAGEVIYGAGKTQEQILGIAKALLEKDARDILITRLDPEKAAFLEGKLPFIYYPLPRIGVAAPRETGRSWAAWWWPPAAPAICRWRRRQPAPPRCWAAR